MYTHMYTHALMHANFSWFIGIVECNCRLVRFELQALFFLVQVYFCAAFFDCTALGPTFILRALTCLDAGPETEGPILELGCVAFT